MPLHLWASFETDVQILWNIFLLKGTYHPFEGPLNPKESGQFENLIDWRLSLSRKLKIDADILLRILITSYSIW